MAQKIHRIKLSVEERQQLEALIAAGKAAAGKRQRAQILLCADENHTQGGLKDRDIARAVGVSVPTVERCIRALSAGPRARRMTSRNTRGGISTSSSIIATLRLDYRGSIALSTESVAWKHPGPEKAAASLCFSSRWS